ncbi:MAG: ATP-dependent RecD-like DNA helicase [Christensenellaceae bacterium]|jgi:exodeoxyribonuclease V alpha subunit|nr:ATP-dependent RecD-like DNA helicase [Christensenellaceae bacterium]
MEQKLDLFDGIVSEIRFQNDENGFCVLSLVAGAREETVVGVLPFVREGERLRVAGRWVTHAVFGRQLQVESFEIVTPTREDEIERFLASGVVKGIGPTMAFSIVRAFGQATLDVLSQNPERLAEVPGIGPKRAASIGKSYAEQFETRETMLFLSKYQISPAYSMRIVKAYGRGAIAILRQNPYRLVHDVQGIGFKTADRIALSMGFAQNDPNRLRAGLIYLLWEASGAEGHVYLPRDALLAAAKALLQASDGELENELKALELTRRVVIESGAEGERVFNEPLYEAEKEVAKRLIELSSAFSGQGPVAGEEELAAFERGIGIAYEGEQRQAILCCLRQGLAVVTGGPGTGKTTVINAIIGILQKRGRAVQLAAPTGRAAKRMSEATGQEAKTIHRLLEYGGEMGQNLSFAKNEDSPLKADALIVDEMSMVDLLLLRSLLRALKPGTRLVLVGDADQLPSVGAGNVLRDIIVSGSLPVARLTQVFRQAAQSQIITNAHRINAGEMPLLRNRDTDFFFERRQGGRAVADSVTALCLARLPEFFHIDPIMEIQVLSPVKRGEAGVFALNQNLQAALNPPSRTKKEKRYLEQLFREGDKVMQVRNNYQMEWKKLSGEEEGIGVFNGDVGRVTGIDEDGVAVVFDDDRRVLYDEASLSDLELAYAITIHKSQGSEFGTVVLALAPGSPRMMARSLLYTAVTRAKERVVLVGSEASIAQMVKNAQTARRYTALSERLAEKRGEGGSFTP